MVYDLEYVQPKMTQTMSYHISDTYEHRVNLPDNVTITDFIVVHRDAGTFECAIYSHDNTLDQKIGIVALKEAALTKCCAVDDTLSYQSDWLDYSILSDWATDAIADLQVTTGGDSYMHVKATMPCKLIISYAN